jgi:hypothetical protein
MANTVNSVLLPVLQSPWMFASAVTACCLPSAHAANCPGYQPGTAAAAVAAAGAAAGAAVKHLAFVLLPAECKEGLSP